MPVYDCGDPDCSECQRAFGPDRAEAIKRYEDREKLMSNIIYPARNLTVRRHMIKNDQCPECRGQLDVGWECNVCGYDAQPELERDKDTLELLNGNVRPGGPFDTRRRQEP